MEERDLDRRIFDEIFSLPQRGFQGLLKGFMFSIAFFSALDISYIAPFSAENKSFQLKVCFCCAVIGYALGLRNESRQPPIIILDEASLPTLHRLGLFGRRALASRAPQTLSEGLVKGLMFSTTMMILASNHLETSTILKIILAATVLGGMWGARNGLRH
jgi:hypothetical protein